MVRKTLQQWERESIQAGNIDQGQGGRFDIREFPSAAAGLR